MRFHRVVVAPKFTGQEDKPTGGIARGDSWPPSRMCHQANESDPERSDAPGSDAPSAHRRPGYPLPGCVPAEPDSVSPGPIRLLPPAIVASPIGHRSHALKIPSQGSSEGRTSTHRFCRRASFHIFPRLLVDCGHSVVMDDIDHFSQ